MDFWVEMKKGLHKGYVGFIAEIKQNIIRSRYQAARLANREQLLLYLQIGKRLSEKIQAEKWGAKVLQQIAVDLQNELPGLRGFSVTNLKNMRHFAEEYAPFLIGQSVTDQLEKSLSPLATGQSKKAITQSPTAKSKKAIKPSAGMKNVIRQSATVQIKVLDKGLIINEKELDNFFSISFTHHIYLLSKCKNKEERLFYIHDAFKDEYLFDFMWLEEDADERIFEEKAVAGIRKFIMTLGKGFSFIGNQYKLDVGGKEYFIDLLFYNRILQCLVVFELKRGKFKPEYAGKLNFYLNVLDDNVKLQLEKPSIGIILGKEKNNIEMEYSFKSINKAMGVATIN